MSQPIDPDDHPLRPEDDSELRYDNRTTDDDVEDSDADEQDG